MRELAVQAASDTYGVTDRAALDLEFGQLFLEMQRIATQTTWNEITVMDGDGVTTASVAATSLTIQLGKAASQNMTLTIKSFDPRTTVKQSARMDVVNPATGAITVGNLATGAASSSTNGGTQLAAIAGALGQDRIGNDNNNEITPGTLNRRDAETQAYGAAVLFVANATNAAPTLDVTLARIDIKSRQNADYALLNLDKAITAVSAERAKYGAYISRLEHAGDNLTNVARHQEQSRSRIADADYAVETSELSRTTIIAQASTAMLAQANAAKQTVLTLLQ
jgi:flagellin